MNAWMKSKSYSVLFAVKNEERSIFQKLEIPINAIGFNSNVYLMLVTSI